MSLVQLHDDAFVRFYDRFAFLFNQKVKVDHLFGEEELFYMRPITRNPRSIDSILATLEAEHPDVRPFDLRSNFRWLVKLLEAEKFLVTGETEDELKTRSERIYDLPVVLPVHGPIGREVNSGAFFHQYFMENPTVFGMQMDVTSRCNEKCIHCYYPPARQRKELDPNLACDVLDQLPAMGTISITFTGGEPFLHREFPRILRRARKDDLTITIQTNGTLLDDDWIKLLKEVNVNTVQFSLYSLKDEDHDRITGAPGSLRKTLRAIESVRAADILISVSCHIMRPNRHSYREILPWAAERNIKAVTDFVMLARFDFSTDNMDNCLTSRETEEVMRELLAVEGGYAKGAECSDFKIDPMRFSEKAVCGAGYDGICLSAEGFYYPCSGFIGYRVGNAAVERLADVWRNSAELKKLRGLKWKDFPQCMKCEAFQFCSMCYGRNFNANKGNLHKVTRHNCEMSFLNKRLTEATDVGC